MRRQSLRAVPMQGPAAHTTVLLLLCIGALLPLAVAADSTQEGYSCDALGKVPAEQRCSFIKSSCISESLVPYAEWYYCHVAYSNVVLRYFYVAAVCCLLPLAFCLLGDTAEFYIAPIMAHVSQAIPKMRPRFAGVTFVALGNGAPDLSANVSAISSGEVVLSAGALTGAAMFVQCIVAAELVVLAGPGGIKCGGAMLRDVGVYCLAILSVLLAFALGTVSRAFVAWAVVLYVVYMIWVFAGDEWHQRGRPTPRVDVKSIRDMLSGYLPGNTGDYPPRQAGFYPPGEGLGSRQNTASLGPGQRASAAGYSSREELEESLLPWAVAEEEEDQYYGPSDFEQYQQAAPGSRVSSLRPGEGLRVGSGLRGSTGLGSLRGASYTSTELSDFGTTQLSQRGSTYDGTSVQGGSPITPFSPDANTALSSQPSFGAAPYAHSGQQQQYGDPRRQWSVSGPGGPAGAASLQSGGSGVQARGAAPTQPHLLNLGNQSYIDAKTYRQLVWADLADDEEEEARIEREIAQQLLAGSRRAPRGSYPGGAAGTYQPPSSAAVERSAASVPALMAASQQLLRPAASMPAHDLVPGSSSQAAAEMESGLLLSPFGPGAVRTAPSTPLSATEESAAAAAGAPPIGVGSAASPGASVAPTAAAAGSEHPSGRLHSGGIVATAAAAAGSVGVQQGPAGSSEDSWQQLQWQVTLGNSEEWADAGAVMKLFRQVTFPLLLPAYLGQRLTIPFASAAGYSREWLIASLLCCPLALILYLGLLTLPAVFAACVCGIAAAIAATVLTWWDAPGQMPVQGLGGMAAAVVPGVLAVLAFVMGVVWIDTIAGEVVGVITFLGGLASLPAGVMGLTLLAWGNSLGDFFGNRAMAKAGHTSTAITACFAAPLFNMLISLALGFSSYLHRLGVSSVKVQLTPEVALGCMFLMGYNTAIICVGRLCGQRLPPWFAHFARAWYGLYFVLSVVSGFWSNNSG